MSAEQPPVAATATVESKPQPVASYVEPFKEMTRTPHKNDRTAWLMSFIDLTGILVGFFVLVYSTETIDRASWQNMAGSFHAAFAANPTAVIPVTPQSQNNAMEVIAARHDALPYLDSLLRQRVQKDPLWSRLSGHEPHDKNEHVMLYPLPPEVVDPQNPAAIAAWKRLADIIRGWKNPVAVRVSVPPSDMDALARRADLAISLARILGEAGVQQVSGEVVSANIGAIELVVRAQE